MTDEELSTLSIVEACSFLSKAFQFSVSCKMEQKDRFARSDMGYEVADAPFTERREKIRYINPKQKSRHASERNNNGKTNPNANIRVDKLYLTHLEFHRSDSRKNEHIVEQIT
jgi:hypothetical protein